MYFPSTVGGEEWPTRRPNIPVQLSSRPGRILLVSSSSSRSGEDRSQAALVEDSIRRVLKVSVYRTIRRTYDRFGEVPVWAGVCDVYAARQKRHMTYRSEFRARMAGSSPVPN